MALDPDKLYALEFPEIRHDYSLRDTVIYALGLGYGMDPLDEEQLKFVDETKLKAVPSMANVLAYPGFWMRDLDTGIDWVKVVHGEQAMELVRPLPPEGSVVGRSKIVDIVDKGAEKGALVLVEREISDASSNEVLARLWQTVFCRGDGGFGGKSDSPRKPQPIPERAPDLTVSVPTHEGLALIYRLSGDLNPLHSDPETARRAGFDRPILHGLATFGIACRGLMPALCGNAPERVRALQCRFSAPVYPGETISLDIWREGEGVAAFRARVEARGAAVLANGRFEYSA